MRTFREVILNEPIRYVWGVGACAAERVACVAEAQGRVAWRLARCLLPAPPRRNVHSAPSSHPPPPHPRTSHTRRYAAGDRVERWLNDLLCLDAAEHTPPPPARLPHPDECELYAVERDTLFSFHNASG